MAEFSVSGLSRGGVVRKQQRASGHAALTSWLGWQPSGHAGDSHTGLDWVDGPVRRAPRGLLLRRRRRPELALGRCPIECRPGAVAAVGCSPILGRAGRGVGATRYCGAPCQRRRALSTKWRLLVICSRMAGREKPLPGSARSSARARGMPPTPPDTVLPDRKARRVRAVTLLRVSGFVCRLVCRER